MKEFEFYNPTHVVFGSGSIDRLRKLMPTEGRVLLTYGGGSIKRNDTYAQVLRALDGRKIVEFGGIEPNPRYETLMQAAELCRAERIDFLLAVGGGSVLDGTKFIAAAARFDDGDPWRILSEGARVTDAIPLGSVLTLPATGSETNAFAVISRDSSQEKRNFGNELVRPRFAVLDPATTLSLPPRQTANGVVDAFVHVLEQYATYPVNAPLQDRQAEAILFTLVEEGPKVLANPEDMDARANIMWCATQALNGLLSCGVPTDWATHMIGHELTAFWGLDHGQSLAVVLPGVWRHQKAKKKEKLLQYGARVWGVTDGSVERRLDSTIERTAEFFRSLGVQTSPGAYGVPAEGFAKVADRIAARGHNLGEHRDIGRDEIIAILGLCR